MVLDIAYFRKSDDPDAIGPEQLRQSQRDRFKDEGVVDEVIKADTDWRQALFKMESLKFLKNQASAQVAALAKAKAPKDGSSEYPATLLDELVDLALNKKNAEIKEKLKELTIPQLVKLSKDRAAKEVQFADEAKVHEKLRDEKRRMVGNLLHPDVPKFKEEDNNKKIHPDIGPVGDANRKKYSHVDLITMIDAVNFEAGTVVSGNRCYYLKGIGVALEQALVSFSQDFLVKRDYQMLSPPVFMNRDIMQEVAQLSQFADELYKVTGKSSEIESDTAVEEKFLIATSEQPIAALHRKQALDPKELPIKYGGISECFRQEVGSHGRDTKGIFRVHQFKKIEQFILASPTESWALFDVMINNAEDFVKSIGLSYQVVDIVSGDLNLAASRKYDLEAWFPGQGTYRELVSCSNCLDYQSRRLDIKFGRKKLDPTDNKTAFVHMLNSTLCATTRMICCILESFQVGDFETGGGVVVPEVLRPYMPEEFGAFIPFVRGPAEEEESGKKDGKKDKKQGGKKQKNQPKKH